MAEQTRGSNGFKPDNSRSSQHKRQPGVELLSPVIPTPCGPGGPPHTVIRALLLASFTPEALCAFCRDRLAFRSVLLRFGPDHGLEGMVAEVIQYCQTFGLWDELLIGMAWAYPRQYARFEPQMCGPRVVCGRQSGTG